MTARPLVIGYGNRLRGDDGVGWLVADALADDPRMRGVDVLAVHQLTPDLVEEVAHASRVVFVDALLDTVARPGLVAVARLEPDPDARALAHHLGPGVILSLADAVYGCAPAAFLVTVTIASAEPGTRLGAAAAGSVSGLIETVVELCCYPGDSQPVEVDMIEMRLGG
jgi:hydrogenase maturation protease